MSELCIVGWVSSSEEQSEEASKLVEYGSKHRACVRKLGKKIIEQGREALRKRYFTGVLGFYRPAENYRTV